MANALRSILAAGALVVCTVAGLTAAKADAIRIALVTAENQADFDNNAALLPTYESLLKAGKGVKSVTVFSNPAKLTIGTASLWESADDVAAVTGSADWKATVAKQKAKTYNIDIYQVQ
jgi:hypothetical protein